MSPLRRQPVQAVLLTLAVGALAAWPARAWAGDAGLVALAAAAATALFGALAGHLPLGLWGRTARPETRVNLILAGLGIRLFVTLIAALVVILVAPLPRMPYGVWLGVYYAAFLVLEVLVTLRGLGQNPPPSEG